MIVVIDSGTGNLRSVVRALERVGGEALVSVDPKVVESASKIVLPGVGSAAAAMETLRQFHLIEPLTRRVREQGVPFLGICLGLQLMAQSSEEGGVSGLGWIEGGTVRMRPEHDSLKIPHLGWNTLAIRRRQPLFEGIADDACFYFAHSYRVDCEADLVAAEANYGGTIAAAIQRDNLFGVQFHPEKSQANGLRLLQNFVEYR